MGKSIEGSYANAKETYLNRNQIISQVADWLIRCKVEDLLQFQSDEVRMADIVALPKDRADKLKAMRASLVEMAIAYLEGMVRSGYIARDFFKDGISSKAELAGEILEQAIATARQEQNSAPGKTA